MKIDWAQEKTNIEKLIMEGIPYERIGKIYGVSGNAIKQGARKHGIELPKRRAINPKETFNRNVKLKPNRSGYDFCPLCGKEKFHKSILCCDCRNKEKANKIKQRTLFHYVGGKKYLSTKCGEIRKDARRVIESSDKEKVCAFCGNHDFDEILEVHHIKGILDFDLNATIAEINDIDNLIWLCPNHHRMLELGLIRL